MNRLSILGIIRSEPSYETDPVCGPQVRVNVKIDRHDLDKQENLSLFTRDDEVMEKTLAADLHSGDAFITTNSYIENINYIHYSSWECQSCGFEVESQRKAELVNGIFADFDYIRDFKNKTNGFGVNNLIVSGRINTRPKLLPTETISAKDFYRTKFKIEVPYLENGKFKMAYVFCVAFGMPAIHLIQRAKIGDRIVINGSLQERDYLKRIEDTCPNCNKKGRHTVYDTVREIVINQYDLYADTKSIIDTDFLAVNEDLDSLSEKFAEENNFIRDRDLPSRSFASKQKEAEVLEENRFKK